jgi:hypothetical protein
MKIQCFACEPIVDLQEEEYIPHMQDVHGTISSGEAMNMANAKKQNLPKQAPVILDKDTPPPPEFLEMAKMMDQKTKPTLPPAANIEVNTSTREQPRQEEKQPLVLKYQWTGTCPTCNTPVKTITLKAKGQTVCVAYCLTHNEITQREVADLEEKTSKDGIYDNHEEHVSLYMEAVKQRVLKNKPKLQIRPLKLRKGGKRKYVKRHKPIVFDKTAIQSAVPTS